MAVFFLVTRQCHCCSSSLNMNNETVASSNEQIERERVYTKNYFNLMVLYWHHHHYHHCLSLKQLLITLQTWILNKLWTLFFSILSSAGCLMNVIRCSCRGWVWKSGQWWCGYVHVDLINHIRRQMGKGSLHCFISTEVV